MNKGDITNIIVENIQNEVAIQGGQKKTKELVKQSLTKTYAQSNDKLRSAFSTAVQINNRLDVGLEDLFVNRSEYNFNVASVYFDFRKFNDFVAVSKNRNQNLGYERNEDCEFERVKFETPIIKEQYHINYASLLNEQFGAVCNDNKAPVAFMIDRVNNAIVSMMNSVKRNMKFQAYEQLQYGKTDFTKIGSNLEILTTTRDSELTKTVVNDWDTASTDIKADLSKMVSLVSEKGRADVNVIIMGKKAQDNFLKNTSIKSVFDNLRFDIGYVKPTERQQQAYNVFGSIVINGRNILLATPKDEFYGTKGTTDKSSYFGDDNVVFLDDRAMDARAYFGGVDMFAGADFNMSINNLNITSFNISKLNINAFNQNVAIDGYKDQGSENLIINLQTAPALVVANPNATALLITKK